MAIERLKRDFSIDQERLKLLEQVVPEAFGDGKINWETLKEALGGYLEDDSPDAEHFGLTWHGKREARRLASLPSQGTLLPVLGEGVNEDNTSNIFIEGDNLEVLKLLQKSYARQIKLIYIDPPYNTGQDFIYKDNFSEPLESYLKRTGQADEEGNLLTSNPKAGGRFHANWLTMMYPRLRLARNLLKDDGAIFISIGEDEVHNLRSLLSEIFGEENFVATLVWQKSKKGDSKLIAQTHEYILVAAKDKQKLIDKGSWRRKKAGGDEVLKHYQELRKIFKDDHVAISTAMRTWYSSLPKNDVRRAHKHYKWSDERGLYFAADFAGPDDGRKSRPRYEINHPVTGKPCKKPSTGWRWDEERTKQALQEKPPRIHFGPDETTIPCRRSYLFEIDTEPYISVFYRDGRAATIELEQLVGKGLVEFPKNTDVLKELIQLASNSDDIILDFFAGSGTTAQAVLELNQEEDGRRKFILVQLPEPVDKPPFFTIADIAKERVRKVIQKLQARDGELNLSGNNQISLGFNSFKLSRSNFKPWKDYQGNDIQELQTKLLDFESPLIEGWTSLDVVIEILLSEGFSLDSKVTNQEQFENNYVLMVASYFVDHRLFICLDEQIRTQTVQQLPLPHAEDVFVCLDSALTDEAKLQLADTTNIKTI